MNPRSARAVRSYLALTVSAAVLWGVASSPAFGFGSTDVPGMGQNSEHQHITEGLVLRDSKWNPKSLKLVTGSAGNFGAVAAPDRPIDSSSTPLIGLGPGYKHCDDGDWLDQSGYPRARAEATAELKKCADYYQFLLKKAVTYAGKLVAADMTVDASVFGMTSGGGAFSPDKSCAYRFSLTPDSNSKCDVLNAFGRSLHLAEDVWSHTNWGDLPDSSQPIGVNNPPGLGNTVVPGFLRFPAEGGIPDGLISGCDDSVPITGPKACSGRVTHSKLAKDNGTFNPDGSGALPTDKYTRGQVVVEGVSNFQRAITGARMQASSTWDDLKQAIVAKYGTERGEAIIAVLQSDSLKAAGLESAKIAEGPPVQSVQALNGEFAADPANDAPLGGADKESDLGHSGLEASADTPDESDREAAGATLGSSAAPDTNGIDASAPAASSSSNSWLWIAIVVVLVLLIVIVFVARKRRVTTPAE